MLKIFNSLSKQIEEFQPIKPKQVGLYTCGPTVYDYPHVGNLRSFIFSDLLHRALLLNGFKVNYVMNITDVDDKTIKKAEEEKKSLKEVTDFYTNAFLGDLKQTNILEPGKLPRATNEIDGMVELIKLLLEKKIAYKTDSGDIYFDISKFPNYGKLAQVDLTNLKQNAEGRLNTSDEYEKEDARDFALWKAYNETDGDVFWETELGKGRPGWHVECSVMSSKYLGQPFDIHTGGIDLMFPHHTNEIAQSEAALGKPLAHFWIHAEHLLVDGSKMSKSKQNFYTLKQIQEKSFTPLAFRYLVLTSHYRSKLDFTWESLGAAQNALNNIYAEISAFQKTKKPLKGFLEEFEKAINNDLNTPDALAVVWDMLRSDNDSGSKLATMIEFDKILGLNIEQVWEDAQKLPAKVAKLIEQRDEARKNKDFSKSDELREEIESSGYLVEDTSKGTRVKKKF